MFGEVEQLAARQVHTLKVAGSSPALATLFHPVCAVGYLRMVVAYLERALLSSCIFLLMPALAHAWAGLFLCWLIHYVLDL